MRWEPKSKSNSKDWDKVAALTEVALQSSPVDPGLLRRLCGALVSLGKGNEAKVESILAQAVARAPYDAELHVYLARVQMVLAKLDEAKLRIDEVLRLAPQSRNGRILNF